MDERSAGYDFRCFFGIVHRFVNSKRYKSSRATEVIGVIGQIAIKLIPPLFETRVDRLATQVWDKSSLHIHSFKAIC